MLETCVATGAYFEQRLRSIEFARPPRIRVKGLAEMSIVVLDSGGRERTAQLEQIASDVRWRAPDRYDQRVVGYRS